MSPGETSDISIYWQWERESCHPLRNLLSVRQHSRELIFNTWGWAPSTVQLSLLWPVSNCNKVSWENCYSSGVGARRRQSINYPDALMWCIYWKRVGWWMLLPVWCDITCTDCIDDFIVISSASEKTSSVSLYDTHGWSHDFRHFEVMSRPWSPRKVLPACLFFISCCCDIFLIIKYAFKFLSLRSRRIFSAIKEQFMLQPLGCCRKKNEQFQCTVSSSFKLTWLFVFSANSCLFMKQLQSIIICLEMCFWPPHVQHAFVFKLCFWSPPTPEGDIWLVSWKDKDNILLGKQRLLHSFIQFLVSNTQRSMKYWNQPLKWPRPQWVLMTWWRCRRHCGPWEFKTLLVNVVALSAREMYYSDSQTIIVPVWIIHFH